MVDNPFDSIESAHEYVRLLREALAEAQDTIQGEIEGLVPIGEPDGARRRQALQLVSYKLDRLGEHLGASSRILNDLRTLRRLLLGAAAQQKDEEVVV